MDDNPTELGIVLVNVFERRDLVAARRAHVKPPRGRIPDGGWF